MAGGVMGFYPKHLKVRRQRWRQRVIAIAVLSGAVIVKRMVPDNIGPAGPFTKRAPVYNIHYSDGKVSHYFGTRYDAAVSYLFFWFDKQGMYPWRNRQT